MSISVRILADSINPAGVRITSWLLTYPRFIHSEFMTHRVFSRNAASSRAIPFKKMVAAIKDNPAFPEYWSAEHKGMGAVRALCESEIKLQARPSWTAAGIQMIDAAERLSELGLAKSLCNRLIEPWSHITVLATATDHRNFFALRAHPDAMPEFQVLAYRMLNLYLASEGYCNTQQLKWGDWHVPTFEGTDNFKDSMRIEKFLKIATARCARLSYLTFDGDHSPEKDIELHDRLLASGHMSPFEHCAQAKDWREHVFQPSNFDSTEQMSGWEQYRKRFPQENRTDVDLEEILKSKPEWIQL